MTFSLTRFVSARKLVELYGAVRRSAILGETEHAKIFVDNSCLGSRRHRSAQCSGGQHKVLLHWSWEMDRKLFHLRFHYGVLIVRGDCDALNRDCRVVWDGPQHAYEHPVL